MLTLVEAGADPNLVNLSGFTALDVALGAARKTLASLTTRISSDSGDLQSRQSCSPEKLSALRSGAALILRSGLTQRPYTPPPLTSRHLSPGRRVKSASTCPSTPCRSPKHASSVTFSDPLFYKNGGLVTKVSGALLTNWTCNDNNIQVQCRIVDTKDILNKDRSQAQTNNGLIFKTQVNI